MLLYRCILVNVRYSITFNKGELKMKKIIYTIQKRTGKDSGGLCSWYEIRKYSDRNKWGMLVDGETIADFNTKKDAEAYCKTNNIEWIKA